MNTLLEQMGRIHIHSMTLFIASLLLLTTNVNSQQVQRPLCASQLALVNWACSKVRYPPPPAFPSRMHTPLDDKYNIEPYTTIMSDNHENGHRHRKRQYHGGTGHRQSGGGYGYSETPEERNCCRWLHDVDDECVCELLVHLPSFLARPFHEYSVIADPSCNVTFSCLGGGPV